MSDRGPTLLDVARNALEEELAGRPRKIFQGAWLDEKGASFVTLTLCGDLRGCVGSTKAFRSIRDDVRENAVAAALRDSRFSPLTANELPEVEIEVSELTPAIAISFSSEEEAIAALRPGVDGVILECEGRHATFLPQVWEKLADPQRFLAELKRKAGFPPSFWAPSMSLWRYNVRKWKEGK